MTVGTKVANLCLNDEALLSFNSNLKVNPPLRGQADVEACLNAVIDGTIDVISSGHQPRSMEKKMQELDAAPFGITSLDTTLAQVITYLIEPGKLSWNRVIECMSTNPAKVLGLEAGSLEVGKTADVIVIDPKKEWEVTRQSLHSHSCNSPLLGQTLQGKTIHAWVGGRHKYNFSD